MPDFWPTLTQPAALLLIPPVWLLLWLLYRRKRRSNYWQQQLPPAFQLWLLHGKHATQQKTPWVLLAIATLFGGLALSSPQLPTSAPSAATTPDPLVLVLELTPDMLASDLPPSRLHQMRSKAMQMLQAQLPGQTAIVVYAGSAHTLLPLSTDPAIADNLLQALHPELIPVPGRNAAIAIARAQELLQQGANRHGRIALLTHNLSSSEQTEIVKLLSQEHSKLAIIGVGSLQGAPVPAMIDGSFNSDRALSRLQEQQLQQFAQRTGSGYARLSTSHQDLLQSQLFIKNQSGQLQANTANTPANTGYWLILPALLALAPLARKGWLFCLLPVLLLQPELLLAAPPDTHPIELVETDPETALLQLQDPMWLGIAAYHAGNFQLAIDYFTDIDSAAAHYNLGNSLMQLGDYANAANAYQQALKLQPELSQARDNLALATQLQQQIPPPDEHANNGINPATEAGVGNQEHNEKTATLLPSHQDFQHGSLDSWLQQIPDNPATLLKRKFRRELPPATP